MTRALLGTLTLLALATSCEPELTLDEALEGRPCGDAERQCLAGYECSPERICVRRDALGAAGAGGSIDGGIGNDPAASGSSAGGAGNASGASAAGAAGVTSTDSGGSTSASGAAGAEPDASAPLDPPDAGSDTDAGCTLIPIFLDRDGDGYGSVLPEDADLACAPPEGWVTVGGDCFEGPITTDSDFPAEVHPGQTEYFEFGYHFSPGDIAVVSFDYDCSGRENPAPDNLFDGDEAPDCSQLSLPCAASGGYERSDRSGANVHPLCGSEILVTCAVAGAACESNRMGVPNGGVFACK